MRTCLEAAINHVGNDKNEVGGLLIGHVWKNNLTPDDASHPLVILEDCIPSIVYRNSSVSLEMGTEIWGRINERLSEDQIVVGWYHSHPNLGAFFSGTDRRTQKAFFYHRYSVGWVIDPIRDEQKIFIGSESDEYHLPFLVIDHGLMM
jgi:proteasome lid subunit RPN8/RPN11